MDFTSYLNGMLEVFVTSDDIEGIINESIQQEIYLRHLNPVSANEFSLQVPLFSIWSFMHIVRKKKGKLRIVQRRGLPFLMSKLKRRKGFLLGVSFTLAMIYLALGLVWTYDVSGNEKFSQQQIIALVQQYGVLPGAKMDGFDYDALSEQFVQDHKDFSWVTIRPQGTKVMIEVKERVEGALEDEASTNLIAKRDGVIKELLILKGTGLVQREQKVQQGQVLIGGWEYLRREKNALGEYDVAGDPQPVRAKGIVYGEVEYKARGMCALTEQVLYTTGNRAISYQIGYDGALYHVWGEKEDPYGTSWQEIDTRIVCSWQTYFSAMQWVKTVYHEQIAQEHQYSLEEAYVNSVYRAREKLKQDIDEESEFVKEEIRLISTGSDQLVQVEVVWSVRENMAKVEKIEQKDEQIVEKNATISGME